jgi:hypothetical protein
MDCLLGHGIGLSAFFHKSNHLDPLPHHYPIVTIQYLLIFGKLLFLLEDVIGRLITSRHTEQKIFCFARCRGIYSTELSTALSALNHRTALSDRLLP